MDLKGHTSLYDTCLSKLDHLPINNEIAVDDKYITYAELLPLSQNDIKFKQITRHLVENNVVSICVSDVEQCLCLIVYSCP